MTAIMDSSASLMDQWQAQALETRRRVWGDVPDEKWNDWRWQLSNRLNSVEEIGRVIQLTDDEIEGLSAPDKFRVDVTPYFATLMDPNDPHCPVRRQVMPLGSELRAFTSMMEDSLAEDAHSPVPGLVHRYPDRVLMLVTTECASYCRYCTRSRIVGDPSANFSSQEHEAQLDYIRAHAADPRRAAQRRRPADHAAAQVWTTCWAACARSLTSRSSASAAACPSSCRSASTDEFCQMIRQYHPLLDQHPRQPPQGDHAGAARGLQPRMADAGIPLGNQSVLLAGVNDSVHIQRMLVHELVKMRVRPYYLYQCDLVEGAGHFRTSVSKGIEIIEGLRGHTSGYAVPTFVVDAPGGGGKIPVMPNYVHQQAPGKVVLRNYEGYITTYSEPLDYDPLEIRHLESQIPRRPEAGQEGVPCAAGRAADGHPAAGLRRHPRPRRRDAPPARRQPTSGSRSWSARRWTYSLAMGRRWWSRCKMTR